MKLLRILASDMPDIVISGYSDADLNQQLIKASIETLESEKARLNKLRLMILDSIDSKTNLNDRYLKIELDISTDLIREINLAIADLKNLDAGFDFDQNLDILRLIFSEVVIDDIAEYVTVCKFSDLGKYKI